MTEAPGSRPGLSPFPYRRPGAALVVAVAGLLATVLVIGLASSWRIALGGLPAWIASLVDIVLINLPMVLAVLVAHRLTGSPRVRVDRRARLEARGIDVLLGLSLAVMMRGLVEVVAPTGGGLGGAVLDADAAQAALALAVLVLGYVLASPVVEEVFFRGLLQRSLAQVAGGSWLARVASIAVSTVLFVFVHIGPLGVTAGWPVVVASVVVGVGCGALVAGTGRLTGAVVAHIGFNGSGVILLLV
ncbi:CPBP family intramembrane glutamic endopeptidase [Microbacterium aquimaris]|uniref:CPBP family intramembrane glutamic endopeptidase n=1 Tax=Microbacterium aquimaris TaxID=459816 RepID=UPI002AD23E8F|nr:CPBP family intramembrane glutamic endopeptidase [Microbacterium aquimaris]MDZ8274732.1 CPBP family intramembrane glutamic endopeptidase [Microbacterium aquimaris]